MCLLQKIQEEKVELKSEFPPPPCLSPCTNPVNALPLVTSIISSGHFSMHI